MVCANYCASYPKQPCVVHEVNMWYPCCMTSFILKSSTKFSQVLWSVLWLCHQVTDVTMWPINPNPSCSKNRKRKEKKRRKIKIKSILSNLDRTMTESLAGRTTQKQQQTWESDNTIRCGSHQGGSPQNKLGDEQTCRMTLASAYVLCYLSAA